jgi:CRISPR-associated protein Cas1
MRLKDLHLLPKFRDCLTYLYVEHCKVEQDDKAVALWDAQGKVPIPAASLGVLMLGPGTSISHAAVTTLADNGCLVLWCGEEGVRLYAQGLGLTRSSANFMHQARLWATPETKLQVIFRLYRMRFEEPLDGSLTLQQLRGREGVRVREAYARASRETGVPWQGRSYRRDAWQAADPINRALSAANSCLYGICHAGILALGLSPALGFIHTGKMLSFVYDVADLYKTRYAIPIAFRETAQGPNALESRVRRRCRDAFRESFLLKTIVQDLQALLNLDARLQVVALEKFHRDEALPGELWDPEAEEGITGGQNFAPPEKDHE